MKLRLLVQVGFIAAMLAPVCAATSVEDERMLVSVDVFAPDETEDGSATVDSKQRFEYDALAARNAFSAQFWSHATGWSMWRSIILVGLVSEINLEPTQSTTDDELTTAQDTAFDAGPDAPAVSMAESETRAVQEEGVEWNSEAAASNSGASVTATASAGSHSQSVEESASVSDVDVSTSAIGGTKASQSRQQTSNPPSDVAPEEEQPSMDYEAPVAALAAAPTPADNPLADPVTAAAIATATVGAAAFAMPGSRSLLWRIAKKLGLVALFSRIAQADILNHERRNELMEFIRHNPGERVEVSRRALGLSNGSMHYHLRVLQDRDLVRVIRDGSRARVYPAGPRIQPSPYVPPQRRRLVEIVQSEPGLTQREVGAKLGLSERMVSYHVRALTIQNLLMVQAHGARKRLFLPQPSALPENVA